MTAYYNEIDPFAANWLRELIKQNLIAPGEVDTRCIEDVTPADLGGFTQHHFFAGIGGWSYALRLAGWPDDKPVWTGSCPCQPFSAAGKGAGFADERHLWPAWHWLIQQCRPGRIFGEQVASAGEWLDLVSADLESQGYAFGAAVLGAHSVGAPHIRQRLYWMADAESARIHGVGRGAERSRNAELRAAKERDEPDRNSTIGELADATEHGFNTSPERKILDEKYNAKPCGGVGDSMFEGLSDSQFKELQRARRGHEGRATKQSGGSFWADCEWVDCRDGKARPVESGVKPLAHGVPKGMVRVSDSSEPINPQETAEGRVMRLKGYGNAICVQTAEAFIRASC
jgi:DNA (cytosine-5)-methyltransferase 1